MKEIICTSNLSYCFDQPFMNIKDKIVLMQNNLLYSPITQTDDAEFYRNDWHCILFRSLRALHGKIKPKSICIIGTGIGLDSIGFVEAFNPLKICLIDLTEELAKMAGSNLRDNIKSCSLKIEEIGSDIFSGLINNGNNKFDLIYENLPNLPEMFPSGSPQPYYASFISNFKNHLRKVPKLFVKNLLSSHYLFLLNAKEYLKEGGGVLCNIGGRVPIKIIFQMFSNLGYEAHILLFEIKKQNEIDSNLAAYAQWELNNDISFKFYPYKLIDLLTSSFHYDKYSGFLNDIENINFNIETHELSAQEAYSLYSQKGIDIAHGVFSIYAKKI